MASDPSVDSPPRMPAAICPPGITEATQASWLVAERKASPEDDALNGGELLTRLLDTALMLSVTTPTHGPPGMKLVAR